MTVREAIVAEARRYLGVRETPTLSNRGVAIDYWLAEAGVLLGLPWCAAFIGQLGRQAVGSQWPLPRTASVQVLYEAARQSNLLAPVPEAGDLFVLWFDALNRYGHVGLVTAAPAVGTDGVSRITTIEGNTNPGGGRDGYGVFERTRTVADPRARYICWVKALPGASS